MSVYDWIKTLKYHEISQWNLRDCLTVLTYSTKTQKTIQRDKNVTPAMIRKAICDRVDTLMAECPALGTTSPTRSLEVTMVNTLNYQIAIIGLLFPMYKMPDQLQLQDPNQFHNVLLQLFSFMNQMTDHIHKTIPQPMKTIDLPDEWPEYVLKKTQAYASPEGATSDHFCILPKQANASSSKV